MHRVTYLLTYVSVKIRLTAAQLQEQVVQQIENESTRLMESQGYSRPTYVQ